MCSCNVREAKVLRVRVWHKPSYPSKNEIVEPWVRGSESVLTLQMSLSEKFIVKAVL